MDANALSDYVKNVLRRHLKVWKEWLLSLRPGQLEESVDVTLDQDKIDALNKKIQKEDR